MKKKLQFIENAGLWDDVSRQSIIDPDTNTEIFDVYNLSECPEDAIIGRDLFDGHDYISALTRGMELAKQGYTELDIEYIFED